MTRKILKAFLPSMTGLLMVFIIAQGRQSMIDYFYPETDAVLSFQPLFDLEFFAISYFTILIFAVLFQLVVALPLEKKYTSGQKFFKLDYKQLVCISCVVFGVVCSFISWNTYMSLVRLIYNAFFATVCAILYWTANLLVLTLIRRRQYGS